MRSFLLLAFIAAIPVGIGALAIWGIRRARSMSRAHVEHLREIGHTDRLNHPQTRRDLFLRPMSLADVVRAIVGALVVGAILKFLSR